MQEMAILEGVSEAIATTEITTFHWESAKLSGLWYPLVKAGERVTQGQVLGHVKDLFGEVKQHVNSAGDGVVLFNVSSLAMNEGDPLVAIGEI